ncbi:hypothetical protein RSP816_16655 (plasmid) [Ralstonia solanacearum]|nr:hypothetical protein RSP816_16655 [Ralstonia solanacearum]
MVQRPERCAVMPSGRLSRCNMPILPVMSIYQGLPGCKKSVRRFVAACRKVGEERAFRVALGRFRQCRLGLRGALGWGRVTCLAGTEYRGAR